MAGRVRIVDAGLRDAALVHVVLSGLEDPDRLRVVWSSSGASIERRGDRLEGVSSPAALMRAAGRAFGREEAVALAGEVERTIEAWRGPTPDWKVGTASIECGRGPVVMGILNVTPDSFSDGGAVYPDDHPDAAVRRGLELVAEGAAMVDVGGESTRPGAAPVDVAEETRRTAPVVRALVDEGVVVAIDTTKPEVAEAAVAAGAHVVNDVGAAADDRLLGVVAEAGVGYVLMHSRATPATMQSHTSYDDVVAEVHEFLGRGIERCLAAGISEDRVVVDPGIGFAKTTEQNLALVAALRQFRGLGRPVLLGASRKRFIGQVLDQTEADGVPRIHGSLAVAALAVAADVGVLRVHDVGATVSVARVAGAVRRAAPAP